MSEWDQRQLCPDGGCTGLIGSDGLCKVCGRVAPNWGDERKRGLDDAKGEDGEHEDDDEDDEDDDDDDYEDDDDEHADNDEGDADDEDDGKIEADLRPETPSTMDGDWRTRKLCPDGGCVGVIGDDGACKTCGKKATS